MALGTLAWTSDRAGLAGPRVAMVGAFLAGFPVMRSSLSAIAIAVGCVASIAMIGCDRGGSPGRAGSPDAGAPKAPSASAAASASSRPAADDFPIARESVELVLNPSQLPPYDGPTGSVEGTVYVTGPSAPDVHVDTAKCPAAIDTYGKLFRAGPALPNGSRPLADAAVVLVGYSGYVPEHDAAKRVTIGARCGYPSRTITMTFGQRLEVANQSSQLFLPVIDQDAFSAMNRVAPPHESGDPVKLYPRKAAYFTVSDNMQPFVHEDLYVFRHPLHTVTDLSGHYRIDGVPVGSAKVGAHSPGVGADAEVPVEVVAGIVQRVDLTVTYSPKRAKPVVDAGRPRDWLN